METPSYYAIIPAGVRYDRNLKANEKLLYAEITALTQMNANCFASNDYFAKLYGTTKETVSRWLSNLEKHGYISRKMIYKKGTKQVLIRYITLLTKTSIPSPLNNQHPIDEKVKDNIMSINTTIYTEMKKKFSFIDEISFNKLTKHLEAKFTPLSKVRLTNNIKKLVGNPTLFSKAVDSMVELDYSGLFVPSKKQQEKTTPFNSSQNVNTPDGFTQVT